ncbi:hypothetical protein CEXT_137271 [Caerostris extrusa]|uniref:Uncharacterized protein n=1 Tax=Caerostris extrusa TaxID=172846 RepID=A0AAV4Y9B1_CAEEX|nr:hypothetical protein CEXT_137271 [Caerostris extrusa]
MLLFDVVIKQTHNGPSHSPVHFRAICVDAAAFFHWLHMPPIKLLFCSWRFKQRYMFWVFISEYVMMNGDILLQILQMVQFGEKTKCHGDGRNS